MKSLLCCYWFLLTLVAFGLTPWKGLPCCYWVGLVVFLGVLPWAWSRWTQYRYRRRCVRRLEEAWAEHPKYFKGLE